MGPIRLRASSLFLAAAIVLGAATPSVALTIRERAERGIGYLKAQQRPNGSIPGFSEIGSTADAVMAIVSAGVGPRVLDRAVVFLRRAAKNDRVDSVGERGKVALAAVAAGEDPRRFGRHNLIREILLTRGVDGRLDGGTVFDHALGVLALDAADAPLRASVTQWLLDGQCPDGGWAFDAAYDPMNDDVHCSSGVSDFFPSDTNTTGYVVMALQAAGDTAWTNDPVAFFDYARDGSAGWGYQPGFATDANSTALVLQAYAAAGVAFPPGSRRALARLQMPRCGAWAYSRDFGGANVGATIGAVPGLLSEPFPLSGAKVRGAAPDTPDCA